VHNIVISHLPVDLSINTDCFGHVLVLELFPKHYSKIKVFNSFLCCSSFTFLDNFNLVFF
jgi:hypothetical protein